MNDITVIVCSVFHCPFYMLGKLLSPSQLLEMLGLADVA